MSMYGLWKDSDRFVRPKAIVSEPGSGAKQAFRDEVNINKILERYNKGQMMVRLNPRPPVFGDVSSVPDYQEAMNKVRLVQESFDLLSAKVRERFRNDPNEFLAFVSNKENIDEAKRLGILVDRPKPVEVVQKVQVVNPEVK